MIPAHMEELVSLTQPVFSVILSKQLSFPRDKNAMFLHCSALLPFVPDRQNDHPGQPPLDLDALYGSVTKTASVLKTVFTELRT